jgi:hypothetical protein
MYYSVSHADDNLPEKVGKELTHVQTSSHFKWGAVLRPKYFWWQKLRDEKFKLNPNYIHTYTATIQKLINFQLWNCFRDLCSLSVFSIFQKILANTRERDLWQEGRKNFSPFGVKSIASLQSTHPPIMTSSNYIFHGRRKQLAPSQCLPALINCSIDIKCLSLSHISSFLAPTWSFCIITGHPCWIFVCAKSPHQIPNELLKIFVRFIR